MCCTLAWSTSHAAGYHLGQGLTAGDFFLSGYVNVVAEAPHGERSQLMLDDLSLFASGRINRWVNPFVEMEVTGLTLLKAGEKSGPSGEFVPERFYNDLHLSESDTLRIGKMLSPVGEWNSIHAAPLVPTTTRPLTTYRGFSEYASGVAWVHESASTDGPDWKLYMQPGKPWAPRSSRVAPRRFSDVWGAHLNWSLDFDDKFGLSFQHGRLATTGETYALIGANARETVGRLSLQGEAISAHWSGPNATRVHAHEWGGYGLADYAVTDRWHGLLEGELYQDHEQLKRSRNLLLGFAYKPSTAAVWKLEYVRQYGDSPFIKTGWLASFAALF